MKRILVAVDGSEQSRKAMALAIQIATGLTAHVTALHVVVPPYVPPEPYAQGGFALEVSLRQYGEHLAQSAADEARKAGLEADWRIEIGSPGDLISEAATTLHADMIVVGSRGQGALRRLMLGSVSDRVAHISQVPVLVVH